MKEIFMYSFNAVMPILLLALTGYILKVTGFADESFFKKANALVFKLFLPVLLFVNIYKIDNLTLINWKCIIYCAVSILFICATGYCVMKIFFKNRLQLGVLTQCTFRSNYAIIGIPLAASLGGDKAVAFASVLSAVSIPVFNTLAVMLLSHYAEDNKKASVKETLKKTLKNPLIIGVSVGVVTVFIRNILPVNPDGEIFFSIERDLPFLYNSLISLSSAASPVALVVLGARFDFSAVRQLKKQICTATFMRLVFAPAFGIGLAFLLSRFTSLLELTTTEYPALVSLYATPVAVSSAVMTGEIGGDEQLAGQLVVWTSLISMLTMFIIIFVLKSLSLV